MHYQEIIKYYRKIILLILDNKILEALTTLSQLAENEEKQYHTIQIEKLQETYLNILKHSFINVEDPARDKIFMRLKRSLLELTDSIKESLLTETSGLMIYKLKWSMEKKLGQESDKAFSLVQNLTFDPELHHILKENNINFGEASGEKTNISRQDAIKELFNYLWLSESYHETENKILQTLNTSSKIPWHDKSTIVSALTLSLLRVFDKNKFLALFDFYFSKEQQVWERALVGIVLSLYKYDERLGLYPDLMSKINELGSSSEIEKELEAVAIQIFKSKDTEKITKKWEEEILPEMLKMQPKIEKNLDLENIVPDKFLEDKNPDWENVFKDSPDLLDKLQDFSQMQIEGSDVFMSAFSKLKQFPFFKEMVNWFTPFYKENETIDLISEKEETNLMPFIEQLEKSHYMCNSDKYSFCLNLQFIPESHKSMMMDMFNQEMESMQEIAKDENLLNQFALSKSTITQYLQDLYRFYKLYPYKKEFGDIFSWRFDLQNKKSFKLLIKDNQIIRNIAEFFFESQHFDQAAEIFKSLEEKESPNAELFEKIGYCYQQMGNYREALAYYKKADLLETNKIWITKKIALCHRYLNQHEKALEYYKEAEKIEPDSLYIQAYIGHSLMRLGQYEEALKYYFKVEYLAPSNDKIQRPIAWISFVLGKFETAINYYTKILEKQNHAFDLIHLGHVYWCINNPQKAIELYREAYGLLKEKDELFGSTFDDDIPFLKEHGIKAMDIDLMKDYLKTDFAANR
ncbi:MAG: tetratricopeptide repeat protein [Bacteroidales bacterium]|jgi:tetratricopeptide (TPR) repeat protein|nr:tetratricopeptide repeat protein [Bacteroidales bacterium]